LVKLVESPYVPIGHFSPLKLPSTQNSDFSHGSGMVVFA